MFSAPLASDRELERVHPHPHSVPLPLLQHRPLPHHLPHPRHGPGKVKKKYQQNRGANKEEVKKNLFTLYIHCHKTHELLVPYYMYIFQSYVFCII